MKETVLQDRNTLKSKQALERAFWEPLNQLRAVGERTD